MLNFSDKTYKPYKSSYKSGSLFFQPKLSVNRPGDKYEQEADAMADKVMRMGPGINESAFFSSAVRPDIQRMCPDCEEEENLQRKEKPDESSNNVIDDGYISNVISSGGKRLSDGERKFFEPRFGYDFSDVRIHTDTAAARSAQSINAMAYTSGKNIVFNENQYSPETESGKRLIAHELTHVVQQGSPDVIKRSVKDGSVCSNTADVAAPPSPLTFLILADANAHSLLTMAIIKLRLDMMTTSGNPSGDAFDAYRRRFGTPAASGNKFKNRFNNTLHDTLVLAQVSEMESLIAILERISNVLSRDIDYRCIGPNVRTIGGCIFDCANTGFFLITCPGVYRIIICPGFWGLTPDQSGIGIIHEAFHISYQYGDHDNSPAATFGQRKREPECYASFVADVNNVTPFDPSCPALP